MKKILFTTLALASTLLLSACPAKKVLSEQQQSQQDFFNNLSSLCGKTFVGKTIYPQDPDHDFAGKKLVATFASCTDKEIRIPFVVGEDHSRTWIISKTSSSQSTGLLFKHDHRHHDGTPDEITMYGGFAGDYKSQQGTAFKQYFLADAYTAELIPAAKSNVWMMEYNPQTQELTYYLERHEKPRYKAILQ